MKNERFQHGSQMVLTNLAALVLCTCPLIAYCQSYDELITKSDQLTRSANYVEALTAAKEAVAADPQQFEGYYYVAYSLYKLDRLDDAERNAKTAAKIHPSKETTALLRRISDNRAFHDAYDAAEKAYDNAEFSKACMQFAVAFSKFASGYEQAGLNMAASCERRGLYGLEGKILAGIVNDSTDPRMKAEALSRLKAIQSHLEGIFNRNTSNGWNAIQNGHRTPELTANDISYARGCFEVAISAFPWVTGGLLEPSNRHSGWVGGWSPYVGVAISHAMEGDLKNAETALRRGATFGLNEIAFVSSGDYMTGWDKVRLNPEFLRFVTDVFGSQAAAEASAQYQASTWKHKPYNQNPCN